MLVDDRLHGHPTLLAEIGDGGPSQRREAFEEAGHVFLLDVHLQPNLGLRFQRAFEQQAQRLDLLPFPRVLPRIVVGDQARGGDQQFVDHPQFVRAERRAGLRDLDDGVHQLMGLHFGRAPGKLDLRLDPVTAQVFPGEVDDFGGQTLAFDILDRLDGRILRYGQHPAGGLARDLAEEQFADLVDVRTVLDNPVVPGNPAIKVSVFHVAANLLGPDQANLHFVVVHVRIVGSAIDGDVPAGLGDLFDRRFLHTAFGQSKTQHWLVQCTLHASTVVPGAWRHWSSLSRDQTVWRPLMAILPSANAPTTWG